MFVKNLASKDDRVVMVKPSRNIRATLEENGYPFKSKKHSHFVEIFDRRGYLDGIKNYIGKGEKDIAEKCPKILQYQFETKNAAGFRISDKCCLKMKEEPLDLWSKEHNRKIGINGIMREEGGRRNTADCLKFNGKKIRFFQPLAKVTRDWEEWFIKEYNIELCKLYYEPYNFDRTGCKGCPFDLNLEHDLAIMEKYLPNEKKQCEMIWKPVYDEYRRIGYRLKKDEQTKLF